MKCKLIKNIIDNKDENILLAKWHLKPKLNNNNNNLIVKYIVSSPIAAAIVRVLVSSSVWRINEAQNEKVLNNTESKWQKERADTFNEQRE